MNIMEQMRKTAIKALLKIRNAQTNLVSRK